MPELSFPDPPLSDEAVLLRPWQDDDLTARYEAFKDPLLLRFSVPTTQPITKEGLRRSHAAREQARIRGEEINFAFVEALTPDRVLGGGSVYDVDLDEGRAAVGFWLAPGARGRGIATRATRLMARWAFDTLGLERLELTTAPDNNASQRVAERCGFAREGLLRSHTRFKDARRDTVIFGLLPGELDSRSVIL